MAAKWSVILFADIAVFIVTKVFGWILDALSSIINWLPERVKKWLGFGGQVANIKQSFIDKGEKLKGYMVTDKSMAQGAVDKLKDLTGFKQPTVKDETKKAILDAEKDKKVKVDVTVTNDLTLDSKDPNYEVKKKRKEDVATYEKGMANKKTKVMNASERMQYLRNGTVVTTASELSL
jgi:hypothetical protein